MYSQRLPLSAKVKLSVSVMGSGRSGTSLTVNLLSQLGFYIEDDLRSPDKHNERGYGESKRLSEINERILAAFGGSNDLPPLLPSEWQNDSRLNPLREEAKQFVASMNGHGEWAWKAPSLSLTFPFWESFLPSNHCCLICIRNPLASTKSHVATGATSKYASTEWFVRNIAAIRNTRAQRRLLVFYEDFFNPKSRQIQEILAFVGKEGANVEHAISKELKHFEFSVEDAMQSDDLSVDEKMLYLLLLQSKLNPGLCNAILAIIGKGEDSRYHSLESSELTSQLEYYKMIANHPYVRFGRRIRALFR